MDTFEVRTDDLMATTNETKSMSDVQDEEMTSLRDHFKDKIRILSSIGQFSYILKIRLDQYDISLTLQLDKDYPSKLPEIIITAPRLAPDQIIVIQQLLQSYCETLLNKPMILSIYSRLLQWFNENNIQTVTVHSNASNNNQANSTVSSTQRSRKNSKTSISLETAQHNYTNEQETEHLKRSSMKTAEDVIARVEWDDLLDKRLFRVGYVDRFLGMQEKSFDEFDFKVDLSTVSDRHSSILAIPKHRIQYFKYNNEIIWDKETRTDLMFGSTGNKQTIYDVIERHKNSMENTDSSRTPDNDIIEKPNVTIPPPRYLTITDGAYKPNYFLSIPMTDPIFISNYSNYQERLLSSYPSMFSSHTSTSNLHLTLLTLHIETASQIEQCIKLFNSLQDEIRYHCSYPDPINLEFNDVNIFHDKVLYVKCKKNQRLENLRTLIVQRLTEEQQKQTVHGIFCAGNYYEFVAHITLLKCKRKYSSIQHEETNEFNFGKQTIDCVRLCSIGKNENNEQKNNCVFQLDLS